MAKFTIRAVSNDVSEFDTQYGKMKSYKLILEEMYDDKLSDFEQTAVQLNQKDTTPPPKKGDELQGTVDMSGQYGPKFVKDKTAYGGAPSGGGRPQSDPKTMYIAYAKDIMVALLSNDSTVTKTSYDELIKQVAEQGLRLMDLANKPAPTVESEVEAKAKELFPN